MPPRFKRRRQNSHLSSSARSSHSSNSQRVRFRRPSLTSRPFPQPTQLCSSHSQAGRCHETPQDSAASQARIHHAADNDEADEDLDQVVMAIDRQQKGAIGCAYYVAREEKLYCLQDVTNGRLDAIETCKPPKIRGYDFELTDLLE
jgi:DNA mismatch repair protein MSH5